MIRILLLSTFAIRFAQACFDPGQNACARGDQECTNMNQRATFTDGLVIGIQSRVYTHADSTKGCYCQYAHVTQYYGAEPMTFKKPIGNVTYVTSCSPRFDAWWDGAQVMNTTGGTLKTYSTDYYDTNYDAMACADSFEASTASAPSKASNTFLIEWPSVSQSQLEVPLPSNVKVFENGDCPGYDSGKDYYPNLAKTDAPSNLANCTCYTNVIQALGNSGSATSYDGNKIATVCDQSMNTYWNGLGWRSKRSSSSVGQHDVTDYCSTRYGSSSYDTGLVYLQTSTQNDGQSCSSSNNLIGCGNNNSGNNNNNNNGQNKSNDAKTAGSVIRSFVCLSFSLTAFIFAFV